MQCDNARLTITHAVEAQLKSLPSELDEHLESCEQCRSFAEDCRLVNSLKALPGPLQDEDFADRMLEQAWEGRTARQMRRSVAPVWLATAASLVIVLGISFTAPWRSVTTPASDVSMQVVKTVPQTVHQVTLLMVSAADLSDASITVQTDEHVELAGYETQPRLTWKAMINAGNNVIDLPVKLLGERHGVIALKVESGGASKTASIIVKATAEQTAQVITI